MRTGPRSGEGPRNGHGQAAVGGVAQSGECPSPWLAAFVSRARTRAGSRAAPVRGRRKEARKEARKPPPVRVLTA